MRERILQSAQELFFKYGIKIVTMDEIAQQLGISKKTIYQFFETKDEIILEIAQQQCLTFRAEFDRIGVEVNNPIEEIWRIMLVVNQFLSSVHPTLIIELKKFYPQSWTIIEELRTSFLQNLTLRNLEKGIQQGVYREDLQPEIICRLHLSCTNLLFDETVFPPQRFSLNAVHRAYVEYFLHGICSEKGFQLLEKFKKTLHAHEL